MGRTVEHFVMNHLAETALAQGHKTLLGEFLPTAKNAPVKTLLPDFGFRNEDKMGARWILPLTSFTPLATQVRPQRTQTT
jgi:predicted enzyme involved in methoxymalonyl-ACP biosynthesis